VRCDNFRYRKYALGREDWMIPMFVKKMFQRISVTLKPGESGEAVARFSQPFRPLQLWAIGGQDAFTISSVRVANYEVLVPGPPMPLQWFEDVEMDYPSVQESGDHVVTFTVQNVGQLERKFHASVEFLSPTPERPSFLEFRTLYVPHVSVDEGKFTQIRRFVERDEAFEGFELYSLKATTPETSVELDTEDSSGFGLKIDARGVGAKFSGVLMKFVKGGF